MAQQVPLAGTHFDEMRQMVYGPRRSTSLQNSVSPISSFLAQ